MTELSMYSCEIISDEWGILIFAKDCEQAEDLAWPWMESGGCEDRSEMEVYPLKIDEYGNFEWLWNYYKDKVTEPCVYDSPPGCNECEKWGNEIGPDGLCDDCRDELEFNEKWELEEVKS